MSDQTQNDQQQNNAKVEKQYVNTINKLKAVVNGENLSLPKKVAKDDVADIVAELFADESKATRENVKTGLRDLLKKHVEMNVEIGKKKKELAALELSKKKEFVQAASNLFDKIDNIDVLQKQYSESLNQAMGTEDSADNITE